MKLSSNGLRLLTEWEGSKSFLYKDAAGYPTIGVGHLLTAVEIASGVIVINGFSVRYVQGLNDMQIAALLAQDVAPTERAVSGAVAVPLTQSQFDALVSFTFNVGVGAFRKSTLLKILNVGDYKGVPAQLMRWTRGGGKVLQGLVNRRKHEIALWNTADVVTTDRETKLVDWKHESVEARLRDCAFMLYGRNMLPESEYGKVVDRINRRQRKEEAKAAKEAE